MNVLAKAYVFGMLLLVSLVGVAGISSAERCDACEACGKAIGTSRIEVGGLCYHPEHLVCKHCDRQIRGRFTTFRDENYHNDCFKHNVALRCAICAGVISGEYLLDHWGNSYHTHHKGDIPSCEYCGRFITENTTGGGTRYSDGREICRICRNDAITDIKEAKSLMQDVAAAMDDFGMFVDLDKVHLHVMGLKQMQKLSGRRSHSLMGFTDFWERRWNLGFSKKRTIDVYVLYGIPRMDMVGTLAHELTHVWHFTRGRLDTDDAFREGSCNYAAYLVLRKYEEDQGQYIVRNMLEDQDPVYGEGFRRVRRFATQRGIDEWIKRLGSNDDLPDGF